MMGRMPQFVPVEELFSGRHFDQEIIVLCVRWYLNFKLSYRDLAAMMGERGIGRAPQFCAGCRTTLRSSRSAGSGTLDRSVAPGGATKPILR